MLLTFSVEAYESKLALSLFFVFVNFCCWLHQVVDLQTVRTTKPLVLFIRYPYANFNIPIRHQ